MTFDIVLGTVGEFIEIAQTITAIFIVYYLFRFLFYSDAKSEAASGDAGDLFSSIRENIKKREDDQKTQEKLDDRQQYLNKSLGFLHRALSAAQELQERLHTRTKSEIDKAEHGTTLVRSNLSSARRNSRGAHRHHHDDMTESLHELHAAIDAVYEQCEELLSKNIPEDEEDRYFDAKAKHFREGAAKISGYIASLYSSVRTFIQKHEEEKLKISVSIQHLEETVANQKAHLEKLKKDAAHGQVREGATKEAEKKKKKKKALEEAVRSNGKKKLVGARPSHVVREGKKKKK